MNLKKIKSKLLLKQKNKIVPQIILTCLIVFIISDIKLKRTNRLNLVQETLVQI